MPDGVVGIFTGGRGTRLGGVAKGLLARPGGSETIVSHLAGIASRAGLRVVLVGAHEGYDGLPWRVVTDDPAGIGPLGGLAALLRFAGNSRAFVLSCDQPFIDDEVFSRLVSAPEALAVAPRIDGRWQPFFSRFDSAQALPRVHEVVASGRRSMQSVLDACDARVLELGPLDRLLRDWDTPEDVARDGGRIGPQNR